MPIYFECSICKDKSDDPEEYIFPISELAKGCEVDDCVENWICEECRLDLIHEKHMVDAEWDEL